MSEDQKSFYTPDGRIDDPEVAHELGNLEDPARSREGELKRQSETNLSDFEKSNIILMEGFIDKDGKKVPGVLEKYPDAFTVVIDDKGRKAAGITDTYGTNIVLFTQYGVFDIFLEKPGFMVKDVDMTRFLEKVKGSTSFFKNTDWVGFDKLDVFKSTAPDPGGSHVSVALVDLANESVKKNIRELEQSAQIKGERKKLDSEEKAKSSDTKLILQGL